MRDVTSIERSVDSINTGSPSRSLHETRKFQIEELFFNTWGSCSPAGSSEVSTGSEAMRRLTNEEKLTLASVAAFGEAIFDGPELARLHALGLVRHREQDWCLTDKGRQVVFADNTMPGDGRPVSPSTTRH
jgi:hypothetical protein